VSIAEVVEQSPQRAASCVHPDCALPAFVVVIGPMALCLCEAHKKDFDAMFARAAGRTSSPRPKPGDSSAGGAGERAPALDEGWQVVDHIGRRHGQVPSRRQAIQEMSRLALCDDVSLPLRILDPSGRPTGDRLG